MAKTKKQGENSACSALFEHAYYSSGYGIYQPVSELLWSEVYPVSGLCSKKPPGRTYGILS